MKVELDIADPIAYGYQFYAFPLAILATEPATYDWVLSNHIHVAYDPDGQDSPVPFCFYFYDHTTCPWLDVVKADREWMDVVGVDMTRLCRDMIRAGYYASLNLDLYYVPDRSAYRSFHQSHDVLIHGFDDDTETFDLYGYTNIDRPGRSRVRFADLAAAYRSLDDMDNDCAQVIFYRLTDTGGYDLNLPVIRESFEEYLSGANVSHRFAMLRQPWDRAYGMESYGPLSGYLAEYLAGRQPYDIRHLHVLWEHKRLMARRMARIAELVPTDPMPALESMGRDLERSALFLRNSMILREQSTSRPAATAMLERLDDIRDRERELMTRAVDALSELGC